MIIWRWCQHKTEAAPVIFLRGFQQWHEDGIYSLWPHPLQTGLKPTTGGALCFWWWNNPVTQTCWYGADRTQHQRWQPQVQAYPCATFAEQSISGEHLSISFSSADHWWAWRLHWFPRALLSRLWPQKAVPMEFWDQGQGGGEVAVFSLPSACQGSVGGWWKR